VATRLDVSDHAREGEIEPIERGPAVHATEPVKPMPRRRMRARALILT
jgi:hypothetical protein